MENNPKKKTAGEVLKEIKRRTRRTFTAEEKIKIVLEGMRGEDSIAAICRKYGIHSNSYFKWSKEFVEAGKRRLSGDTLREASRDEVSELRNDLERYQRMVGKLFAENSDLKKTAVGLASELGAL
jgi:transposase